MSIPPDWSRITNTTIANYLRDEVDAISRNRKFLAMLQSKGRVSFNNAGQYIDWKVEYKEAGLSGFADGDVQTFSRKDRDKTAQLPYRGYNMNDAVGKMERLKNRGEQAIVKIFETTVKRLTKNITNLFNEELYIDGNGTGNGKRLHGLESMFAGATASSGGTYPVGVQAATYAGMSTVLASAGGGTASSGSVWPVGTFDANYDFWSPLIVDYTSSISGSGGWAATTKTWPNTCLEAIRFMIVHARRNKGKEGQLDYIELSDVMFRQFLDKQDSKERIIVSKAGLRDLGFLDVVNQDGCEVTTEYGIPPNVGYALNVDQMELMSMQSQLFDSQSDEDLESKSFRFSIDFFGNLRFEAPRYFGKFVALNGN